MRFTGSFWPRSYSACSTSELRLGFGRLPALVQGERFDTQCTQAFTDGGAGERRAGFGIECDGGGAVARGGDVVALRLRRIFQPRSAARVGFADH